MTKSTKYKNILKCLSYILIIAILIVLLSNPKANMDSFTIGITMWAKFVLPALFPILFFTSFLNLSGILFNSGKIFAPITKKCFHCSGIAGYIYLLSILSGYPVGAKATSELYQKRIISREEACRITSFASTSGPLFILGTVGAGMFGNIRIGVIILVSHLLGAFINGICFKNLYYKQKAPDIYIASYTESQNILEDAMLSSIKSILTIGGYISLCYLVISILRTYNILLPITSGINAIFGIDVNITNSILTGLIEMTSGIRELSLLGLNDNLLSILSTAIITFGGLSIFLQAYTYLRNFKINLKVYFLEKILHTIIATIICSILVFIF